MDESESGNGDHSADKKDATQPPVAYPPENYPADGEDIVKKVDSMRITIKKDKWKTVIIVVLSLVIIGGAAFFGFKWYFTKIRNEAMTDMQLIIVRDIITRLNEDGYFFITIGNQSLKLGPYVDLDILMESLNMTEAVE